MSRREKRKEERKKEVRETRNGLILVIAILIGVPIWLVSRCVAMEQDASPPPEIVQSECDSIIAYIAAKEVVKRRLRAPQSARFPAGPSSSGVVTRRLSGDCRWQVSGFVDAENSFGSEVRSHFEVVLQVNPETERYGAESVSID